LAPVTGCAAIVTAKKDRREMAFPIFKIEFPDKITIDHNAEKYWREIPDHFPFITLDEFTMMPNHLHGFIVIGNDRILPGGFGAYAPPPEYRAILFYWN
jgi:hypothetical protein